MADRGISGAPRTFGGRLGIVEPLTEQRAAYNELLAIYASRGYFDGSTEPKIVPFPSTLRSDIILTGANAQPTSLEFAFRTDQPNQGMNNLTLTDNRLDINDEFYVSRLALSFGVYNETGGATIATAPMQQFPNGAALADGGFSPAGALAVQCAYNGTMQIDNNAVKFMDQLGLDIMVYADTAQRGVQVSGAGAGAWGANSKDYPKGWYSLVPGMLFSGRDKTRFRVTIPDPRTFALAGGQVMFVALQLDGLRIQNASAYRN